ncbi:MAG: hypothetical protein KKG25_01575 [Bacteroidetes bacterium]|nr:hypothetical protein [Bacteroidota bacterium]MBU1483532.1 hypothetical protein [Bacteroidota bacterium]MBU2269241.1 hypothetical protein [Bacteroidota bacterium]MBU2376774.1 hypothetical protein [Bacteroidota bacterium]
MSLSSNSLIHFTSSKEALIGILKNDFNIKYCLENIESENGNLHYAIPMVSFCDIPLSEIKEHISKYGSYGIGLKREWGKSKKLNPVLYVDKNSTLIDSYYKAFEILFFGKKINELTDTELNLAEIVRYMKNYQADLIRNGQVFSDYKFADEKEWRFVPSFKEAQMIVRGDKFKSEVKQIANKKIENLKLRFEPNDIKYIIINDELEIPDFIEVLRKSKGTRFTLEDIERLYSRIITTEQILTDF